MKRTLLISHILHIKTINTITRQAETKDGNHNSHRFDTGVKQFFFLPSRLFWNYFPRSRYPVISRPRSRT